MRHGSVSTSSIFLEANMDNFTSISGLVSKPLTRPGHSDASTTSNKPTDRRSAIRNGPPISPRTSKQEVSSNIGLKRSIIDQQEEISPRPSSDSFSERTMVTASSSMRPDNIESVSVNNSQPKSELKQLVQKSVELQKELASKSTLELLLHPIQTAQQHLQLRILNLKIEGLAGLDPR